MELPQLACRHKWYYCWEAGSASWRYIFDGNLLLAPLRGLHFERRDEIAYLWLHDDIPAPCDYGGLEFVDDSEKHNLSEHDFV